MQDHTLYHYQHAMGDLIGDTTERKDEFWYEAIPALEADHPYSCVDNAISTAQRNDFKSFSKSFASKITDTQLLSYFNYLKSIIAVENYHGMEQTNCYCFHISGRSAVNDDLKLFVVVVKVNDELKISDISIGDVFENTPIA